MPEAPVIEGVEYDRDAPILDREQIDTLLMADDDAESKALLWQLYELFRDEGEGKLADLSAVCSANDLPRLRKIVHFVAGSAGNLGLARLALFYRGIEHAIDNGTLTDATVCEAPVRREFAIAGEVFRCEMGLDAAE